MKLSVGPNQWIFRLTAFVLSVVLFFQCGSGQSQVAEVRWPSGSTHSSDDGSPGSTTSTIRRGILVDDSSFNPSEIAYHTTSRSTDLKHQDSERNTVATAIEHITLKGFYASDKILTRSQTQRGAPVTTIEQAVGTNNTIKTDSMVPRDAPSVNSLTLLEVIRSTSQFKDTGSVSQPTTMFMPAASSREHFNQPASKSIFVTTTPVAKSLPYLEPKLTSQLASRGHYSTAQSTPVMLEKQLISNTESNMIKTAYISSSDEPVRVTTSALDYLKASPDTTATVPFRTTSPAKDQIFTTDFNTPSEVLSKTPAADSVEYPIASTTMGSFTNVFPQTLSTTGSQRKSISQPTTPILMPYSRSSEHYFYNQSALKTVVVGQMENPATNSLPVTSSYFPNRHTSPETSSITDNRLDKPEMPASVISTEARNVDSVLISATASNSTLSTGLLRLPRQVTEYSTRARRDDVTVTTIKSILTESQTQSRAPATTNEQAVKANTIKTESIVPFDAPYVNSLTLLEVIRSTSQFKDTESVSQPTTLLMPAASSTGLLRAPRQVTEYSTQTRRDDVAVTTIKSTGSKTNTQSENSSDTRISSKKPKNISKKYNSLSQSVAVTRPTLVRILNKASSTYDRRLRNVNGTETSIAGISSTEAYSRDSSFRTFILTNTSQSIHSRNHSTSLSSLVTIVSATDANSSTDSSNQVSKTSTETPQAALTESHSTSVSSLVTSVSATDANSSTDSSNLVSKTSTETPQATLIESHSTTISHLVTTKSGTSASFFKDSSSPSSVSNISTISTPAMETVDPSNSTSATRQTGTVTAADVVTTNTPFSSTSFDLQWINETADTSHITVRPTDDTFINSTTPSSDGYFYSSASHTPRAHSTQSDDNISASSTDSWITEVTGPVSSESSRLMTLHVEQLCRESTSVTIAVTLNNSELCLNYSFTVSLICANRSCSGTEQLIEINDSSIVRFDNLQPAHSYWLTSDTSCPHYQSAANVTVYTAPDAQKSPATCRSPSDRSTALTINFTTSVGDAELVVCVNDHEAANSDCPDSLQPESDSTVSPNSIHKKGSWHQVNSVTAPVDIHSLIPYTTYTVNIVLKPRSQSCLEVVRQTLQCTTAEATPDAVPFLNSTQSDSSTIIVHWQRPINAYGQIINFKLDLQPQLKGEKPQSVTLGASHLNHKYPDLTPGDYTITVTAQTNAGFGVSKSHPFTVQSTEAGGSALVIVMVVILCFLLVLAVAGSVLIFVIHRRPGLLCSSKSGEEDGVPIHMVVFPTKPVAADEFVNSVQTFAKDSGLLFNVEFEELKLVGRDQCLEQAELQCNRVKNRFTNILPYDHSRVKLIPMDDIEGSDYINANWIPGYNSKREYIATQGPLPSTKDDFWRMVWEYNCRAIVMLTLCLENHRIKCEQYWPIDSEPLFYGDLQISITHETKTRSWHIRDLQICLGEQTRTVRHFHYVEWPDMKVPDTVTMLEFVRTVRAHVDSRTGGPFVVHCSAGVGRTGTFIALDVLLQQLRLQHVLDVYGVVYKMRMNRLQMVQTEQQYVFIYECLKYAILSNQNSYANGTYDDDNEEEITDTESVQQDNDQSTDEE